MNLSDAEGIGKGRVGSLEGVERGLAILIGLFMVATGTIIALLCLILYRIW